MIGKTILHYKITEKGQVRITDFGLAKLGGRTQLTTEGTTLGTVAYMSTEQAQGAPVDHRTDIWGRALSNAHRSKAV